MIGGPVLFSLPGFGTLLRPVPIGAERGVFAVERFANGELHVRIEMPVDRRDCVVVGSAAPPDRQLVELLLVADTLRRNGAARIRAVLPYLAYARQDHVEPGASLTIAWLGRMLAASGVDEVVTVDPHSNAALRLMGLPVHPVSGAALLASRLLEHGDLGNAVVVAPDGGAIDRAIATGRQLDLPVAWIDKRRTATGVEHGRIVGPLRESAIVVDDILDTGATLLSCCAALRAAGVEHIDVAVTHGLFTGDRWPDLLGTVRSIHVTDTVLEARHHASRTLYVHAIGDLLEGAVRARLAEPAWASQLEPT